MRVLVQDGKGKWGLGVQQRRIEGAAHTYLWYGQRDEGEGEGEGEDEGEGGGEGEDEGEDEGEVRVAVKLAHCQTAQPALCDAL